MILFGAAALALTMYGTATTPGAPGAPTEFAEVEVRKQIIIRSIRIGPIRSNRRPLEWKESKGPRCVSARAIAGASLLGHDSVDLMLHNRRRVRARLESSCPALDYYHGFYIVPGEDGRICADRDAVRSRMGGRCGIEQFRLLKPHPKP